MNDSDSSHRNTEAYHRHLERAHTLGSQRHKQSFFQAFAQHASTAVGKPWALCGALAIVVVWACSGPLFHYSDTWQLVINTGTTIITFLMVFLIQNAQNRDATALRLKIDELILATRTAQNMFVDIESLDDEQLNKCRTRCGSPPASRKIPSRNRSRSAGMTIAQVEYARECAKPNEATQ